MVHAQAVRDLSSTRWHRSCRQMQTVLITLPRTIDLSIRSPADAVFSRSLTCSPSSMKAQLKKTLRLQSVVNQTISGLACGRPIKGNVTFLGGPLFFNSELRNAFERTLEGKVDSFWMPEEAQIYVALGAALSADGQNPIVLSDLLLKLFQYPL